VAPCDRVDDPLKGGRFVAHQCAKLARQLLDRLTDWPVHGIVDLDPRFYPLWIMDVQRDAKVEPSAVDDELFEPPRESWRLVGLS